MYGLCKLDKQEVDQVNGQFKYFQEFVNSSHINVCPTC